MNLPITLVALAALAAILPVESQGADSAFAENHSVSFISMNSGLSHNLVDDLFLDSEGYVWIATSASLARYDGYEFVNFTPQLTGTPHQEHVCKESGGRPVRTSVGGK